MAAIYKEFININQKNIKSPIYVSKARGKIIHIQRNRSQVAGIHYPVVRTALRALRCKRIQQEHPTNKCEVW